MNINSDTKKSGSSKYLFLKVSLNDCCVEDLINRKEAAVILNAVDELRDELNSFISEGKDNDSQT